MKKFMSEYLMYVKQVLPLTFGLIFILISLCYLVVFLERGANDWDLDEEIWRFIFFSVIGIPLFLLGYKKINYIKE